MPDHDKHAPPGPAQDPAGLRTLVAAASYTHAWEGTLALHGARCRGEPPGEPEKATQEPGNAGAEMVLSAFREKN